MIDGWLDALLVVAVLGCALVSGIFFAFSTFIMRALARVAPEGGIAAMQAINVTVINAWFLAAFFGTALLSAGLAGWSLLGGDGADADTVTAGAALYLFGCIGVTLVFNVPLNNALARCRADTADGAALWQRYLAVWTAWNHVRTAASLLAALTFVLALR